VGDTAPISHLLYYAFLFHLLDTLHTHLTCSVMAHGYSLRSNAKGRRGHKSTDETDDDQVEGTSISASTASRSTRERGCKPLTDELEGDSGIVDPPNSDTSDSPAPTRLEAPATLTSSAIGIPGTSGRPETWEDIQAARKREEARGFADAVRIRRKQIVRGYEEELCLLRERIMALRREGEVQVKKARRKWAQDWAFEKGEVAVVVDESPSSFVVVGSD
jgi:hypothetical protein